MSKRMKTVLIVIGIAVVAYFLYRWYQNRQASNSAQSPTGSLGSNLNSVAPIMEGGSSTGGSGLTYTAPSTTVNLELPGGTTSSTSNAPSGNVGPPVAQAV